MTPASKAWAVSKQTLALGDFIFLKIWPISCGVLPSLAPPAEEFSKIYNLDVTVQKRSVD